MQLKVENNSHFTKSDLLHESWRKLFADLAGIARTMYLAVFILKIMFCTNIK